ncbi:DHS-like NAD/FAD-binding domain-containing protein [Filobasidium floriforme]|uniref:DHS-like NAD/FAD-binding domain-containing protein n=1 Tax=Filobasidium floriforme TaxID=5210 RepID=UPI001E8EF01F|nr:DHS-like NAD/FAD-binding domain-containing protein [Filobasidium floriforme]KAH8086847.1 DHS-like NAD/FAD-binding domain-containing protein [Filobasidium floriforme]
MMMKIASFPQNGSGSYDTLKGKDKILFDKVIVGIVNSKKVVVVAGAGLSCSSGIPDFRSENGLYSLVGQMESDNTPSGSSSSTSSPPPSNPFQTGKDLFTSTTAFATPHSTSLYLRFIGSLLLASRKAEPTRAHRLLKRMEDKGRLLRIWTQNVDGLEARAGLSGGRGSVGEEEFRTGKVSARPSVLIPPSYASVVARSRPGPGPSTSSSLASRRRSIAKPRPPVTMELHGNVHYARCNLCSEEYVTRKEWVDEWVQGRGIECEACGIRAIEREFRNARAIKTGMLLPSLVLYDQPHPQGEEIITSQDKDLAKKPDCLIIMGTSLKVVGIKRLVKDFIKGIREDQAAARIKAQAAAKCLAKPATPSAAARAKKPLDKLPVIFVNKTPPDKEWEGLIDVWIEAECDAFAEGCEKIWRGVRPGDWEVQETLDDCRVGWKQVERAVQGDKGKAVATPSTPRKNKERNPLGSGLNVINRPEPTTATPSTPKRKSTINILMTPEKTPLRSATRALKRTRNDDEENDPFNSSAGSIALPPTPEQTPKKRRRHTDYGPAKCVAKSVTASVQEPVGVSQRRYRTRSRVSGFDSEESDLSEGLA